MNIVIIAYRPDHTDVCRGCSMGTTESDMQYFAGDDIEVASNFLAARICDNETRDIYAYAEYEFTYIINGKDESEWEPESEEVSAYYQLLDSSGKKAYKLVEEYKENLARLEAEKKQAEEERTRANELARLQELQEKYKDG